MSERKPIDSALRHYLDAQAGLAAPAATNTDQERANSIRDTMLQALASRTSIGGLPNAVQTEDLVISDGVKARIYKPGAGMYPVLIYLHGGGWVAGSIETHDPFCRLLSAAANIIIVSVDYRLAPEHRYPAALEDVLAAIEWVKTHASEWGGDLSRLALGGDSAGANLAAVAANQLSAKPSGHPLRVLLLLYPATDHYSANYPSYTENATGYGLEANRMRWLWDQYAPDVSPADTNISPLRLESVPQLPPTLIATAEYDVLRDEGIAYVEKLRAAKIPVEHLHAPDMHHNFPVHPATVARFPQCDSTLTEIANWLKGTLAEA